MRFADYAKIYVTAGTGGPGSAHMRRDHYIPKGGPDGGDGGRGRRLLLRGPVQLNTILDLRYTPSLTRKPGDNGRSSRSSGTDGTSVILRVPLGTVTFAPESRTRIAEITDDEQEIVIAKGGTCCLGTWHFNSTVTPIPHTLIWRHWHTRLLTRPKRMRCGLVDFQFWQSTF